jgi:hypothetical protein
VRMAAVWSRAWKTTAVLAFLAAVLGIEMTLFGDQLSRNLDVLLAREQTGRAAAARQPAPLPVVAPPAAGPITQVELRPLDRCRAGKACTALVQIRLAPQRRPVRVAWRLEIFDRCRQTRDRRPGGVSTVEPGRDRLVVTHPLDIPAASSLAVIAVITEPVTVAGQAMPLPGGDRC